MIVRNEQEMLPDFLKSVSGLWDEFIAVDTGSTDDTAAILAAAGARIVPFKWIDDFAAARNASLAPATGRWILFLDADERVSENLAAQIRTLVENEKAGAATVMMRNEIPGGLHRQAPLLRLFRNDPSITFEHRIHEDPSNSVQAMLDRKDLVMHHLDGIVDHLGYVREVAADRKKKQRDLTLLNQSLEQNPEDFYCWFKTLEIARFWEDRPLWKETATSAAESLDAASAEALTDLHGRHWGGEFAALVSQGLHEDPALCLAWLDKHSELVRPSAAWHLRRGFLLEEASSPVEAEAEYHQCLAQSSNDPSGQSSVRPLLGLCRLAAAQGDLPKAQEYSRQAAEFGPVDPEALLALAAFHPARGGTDSSTGTLSESMLDLLAAHPEATVPLARALLSTGRTAGAAHCLRKQASEDAEAALGLLVCTLVLGENVDLQVNVEQDEADGIFQTWIHTLVNSRNEESIQSFMKNSVAVVEVFPWLPQFFESLV